MPRPNQESPVFCRASNQDKKNVDILCMFKRKSWIRELSNFKKHIKIQIKKSDNNQEPTAPPNPPNQDLMDMGVLCNFEINSLYKHLNLWSIRFQEPYLNHDQDLKPQYGASSKALKNK